LSNLSFIRQHQVKIDELENKFNKHINSDSKITQPTYPNQGFFSEKDELNSNLSIKPEHNELGINANSSCG